MPKRSLIDVIASMAECADESKLMYTLTPCQELNLEKRGTWRVRAAKERALWEQFQAILNEAHMRTLHTPPEAMGMRWRALTKAMIYFMCSTGAIEDYREMEYTWFVNAYKVFLDEV